MIVVATIAVDAEDASEVVNTILKATKTLKVVELHIEIPQVEDAVEDEGEFLAAEYTLPEGLKRMVKVD